ncbi:hypothetical protein D3C76_1513960 [compost metagenome]
MHLHINKRNIIGNALTNRTDGCIHGSPANSGVRLFSSACANANGSHSIRHAARRHLQFNQFIVLCRNIHGLANHL